MNIFRKLFGGTSLPTEEEWLTDSVASQVMKALGAEPTRAKLVSFVGGLVKMPKDGCVLFGQLESGQECSMDVIGSNRGQLILGSGFGKIEPELLSNASQIAADAGWRFHLSS